MTGHENDFNQQLRVIDGRLAFRAYQLGLIERMQAAQDRANTKRAARLRPRVIRPLVVAEDPQTGERRILSELRREYPDYPAGEFLPTASADAQSWLSRLWGRLVAGVVAARLLTRKLRPADTGRF